MGHQHRAGHIVSSAVWRWGCRLRSAAPKVVCILIGGTARAGDGRRHERLHLLSGICRAAGGRADGLNIYSGGTSAVEAGAYVAELIETILKEKASGVDLKH